MNTWAVITGDCREVLPTLPPATVDLVLADPPYGETALGWDRRVDGWLQPLKRVLRPTGSLWCFGSLRFLMDRASDFKGWRQAQDVVWEKHNGSGFDRDRFRRVHELVVQLYPAEIPWSRIYRLPQKVVGDPRPSARIRSRKGPRHRGVVGLSDYDYTTERLMRSVLRVPSCHGRATHPTQKPEALLLPLIKYSCPPGGVVLDPFCGSGSTGLAAQMAGMDFIGIEIDPEWAAVARRRLSGDVRGDAPLLDPKAGGRHG